MNQRDPVADGFTARNGLLYNRKGEMVALPVADDVAREYGFLYVERLVTYLEEKAKEDKP